MSGSIESVLHEHRVFPPSDEFRASSRVPSMEAYRALCDRAAADPDGYWAEVASELAWAEPWSQVCDWQPPDAKWFVGGKLNATVSCLDRHAASWRRNKAALLFEGEPGDSRVYTYGQLHREVCQAANALTDLGVQAGDFVAIYLPMIPEAVIAMLAVRTDRRGAHGRVRRLLGRGARRSHARRARADRHHRRRRLAARPRGAAQGQRRQRLPPDHGRAGRGGQAHRPRRGVGRHARRVVARGREHRVGQAHAAGVRQRAPAVLALHQRHDRQAQGHPAHHRRLPDRRRLLDAAGLRSARRGHLLVHRRHRLGHRPQRT